MQFDIQDLQFVSDVKLLAQQRGWHYRTHHPPHKQYRRASQTIQSQAEKIVSGGKEQAAAFFTAEKDLLESERQIARLYATREYTMKETFTCEIPNATVLGHSGMVVTEQGEALLQSTILGSEHQLRGMLRYFKRHMTSPERVEGRLVSLAGTFSFYYGHWLPDYLPRLSMVDLNDSSLRFLLPHKAFIRRFHYESLYLLGIRQEQCIQPESELDCYTADTVILCHPAQVTTNPSQYHLVPIINQLKASVVASEGQRRVYLSRENVKRKVVNEADLLPLLDYYGFELVRPDELSLRDQVRMFSESSVLMGANGSGTVNLLWCPTGATIIEFLNPLRWTQDMVHYCGILGHEHWHIWAKNLNDDYDMSVDIVHLDELLSTALREPAYHPFVREYLDAYPME